MRREHRFADRAMRRRLRAAWGPALDAFFEVYVCVEEHALLSSGYALGAWARTRSLHETAVIAALLSSHGWEPETDLAERFLLHAAIDEEKDLRLAQAEGFDVDPDELARAQKARADLIAQYGKQFATQYGWAVPLFPSVSSKARVTFEQLEAHARSGLGRFDYRLGSHPVHSSAWTVELSTIQRGDMIYRLTGPTNIGFTDPAAVALAGMMATTSSVVYGLSEIPDPMYIVALHAFVQLSVRALELFGACEADVLTREERRAHR